MLFVKTKLEFDLNTAALVIETRHKEFSLSPEAIVSLGHLKNTGWAQSIRVSNMVFIHVYL